MRKEDIPLKYIIMCGGKYKEWEKPRQLVKINDEPIVARTIRLLRECGVKDIAISANDPVFEQFGVPVLNHNNDYDTTGGDVKGYWSSAFYPTDEPTCYLFGDVVFSSQAIRMIVRYETDSIMFFGSKKPFAPEYPKRNEEPFAFKVVDVDLFRKSIEEHKRLTDSGRHWRRPIAWELWFICSGQDPAEDLKNLINNSYVGINDYTCDIDTKADIARFEKCEL